MSLEALAKSGAIVSSAGVALMIVLMVVLTRISCDKKL